MSENEKMPTDAGVLDGYREGRRTWVSVASIEKRLSEIPKAGSCLLYTSRCV